MIIVGIDLSGPANHRDTAIVWFSETVASLMYNGYLPNGSDDDIVRKIGSGSVWIEGGTGIA